MVCTGRRWVDFCSYSPAFPAAMRMVKRRIERGPEYIAELEHQVREFLAELDQKLAALTTRYGDTGKVAA